MCSSVARFCFTNFKATGSGSWAEISVRFRTPPQKKDAREQIEVVTIYKKTCPLIWSRGKYWSRLFTDVGRLKDRCCGGGQIMWRMVSLHDAIYRQSKGESPHLKSLTSNTIFMGYLLPYVKTFFHLHNFVLQIIIFSFFKWIIFGFIVAHRQWMMETANGRCNITLVRASDK